MATNKSFSSAEGWGNDTLSRFQEMAFTNEMSTFAHFPKWHGLLNEISIVLEKCSHYANDEIGKSYAGHQSYVLFIFAYSDYLALVRCAAAGHCLPAYAVGRASIEFSWYSWYLSTSLYVYERWAKKPIQPTDADKDSPQYKKWKKWNAEFSFHHIIKNNLSKTDEGLSILADYLYKTAIDEGGHPNLSAYDSNTKLKNKIFQSNILHEWNDPSQKAMLFAVEVGMFLIRLFAISFRKADDAIGLTKAVAMFANELKLLQERGLLTKRK